MAKTVLITGCGAGGIGHALATRFRQLDFTVIATLLPFEDSKNLEIQGVHVTRCDVTNEESVLDLVNQVNGISKSTLDILINNAGICKCVRLDRWFSSAHTIPGYTMTAADTDVHEVEKMFRVNVFGPMRMVHHFHRMLICARGTVVNIGSVGGIVPYVYGGNRLSPYGTIAMSKHICAASYNASKAALHHYGNTLRAEMKPFGVKVVNIISGEVSTNILRTDQKNSRSLPSGTLQSAQGE